MTPSTSGSPLESLRTVLARISSLIGRDTQPLARSSSSVAGRDMALLGMIRACTSVEPRRVYVATYGATFEPSSAAACERAHDSPTLPGCRLESGFTRARGL